MSSPTEDDLTRTMSTASSSNQSEISPPELTTSGLAKGSPRTITSGSIINGRFVLDELLGRGGMGIVYRALDKRKAEAQDRNPYVAIKILGDEFSQHPKAFIALQRECAKSQALAHPHIITVYDFDRDGDIVYMTMEQLSGSPLDQLIKQNVNGLPLASAKKIIRQLAQALAYAHSKSIVHSDLKPANVFISDDFDVKILDFGIARAVSDAELGQGDTTLFDAGDLGGLTPTYASLEMFNGDTPHTSDDIFALGIIAYEIITGKHPFARKPAPKAVDEGLSAKKIKQLKRHEWSTVSSALALTRNERLTDANLFLKKFNGTSKAVKLLSLAIVILSITFGAITVLTPSSSGPEQPLDKLPEATRTQVLQTLNEADNALTFNDFNGALFFYNQAFELHPYNRRATAGMNTIVDALIDNIDWNTSTDERKNHLRQIDNILEYGPLKENKRLLKAKQRLINND